ncbi:MAG: alcohol dehydrogenase catalytic domain-containing protein [Rhizobiales bacterium]|nr:alcohol dehydrogenase catalytic domain-containing protein [Hyphomicrobiales bacterium]
MRAIVIEGPGRVALRDVASAAPGAGEVRLRPLAVGICGTDVEIADGTMPYFTSGMAAYPVIPGHEWVGEIESVGAGVEGFRAGDRVVGECSIGCGRCALCRAGDYHRCLARTETGILNRNGGFAEFLTFPAAYLHRISPRLPVEVAALVEPSAVAFNGVRRAGITPRDDVVVLGDGPIGLLVLQVARAFGARSVTVVGGTPARLAIAERTGATATVDFSSTGNVLEAVRSAAGAAPSVVIEATGNPAAAGTAIATVASGGRIVFLGIFAGQKADQVDLDRIVTGDITIRGALGSPGVWPDVIALIEGGRIDPGILVSETLPLAAFSEGIARVKARSGIKIVVRPTH